MGAEVEVTDDGISAKADRLRGARITLPYPSVGATETVLLSAVLAEGRTVLQRRGRARGDRAGAVPAAHGRAHRASAPTAAS